MLLGKAMQLALITVMSVMPLVRKTKAETETLLLVH